MFFAREEPTVVKNSLKEFAIVKGSLIVFWFIVREDTDELLVDFKVTKHLIPDQVFLMSLDEFAKNVSKYCLLDLLM